MSFAGRLVIGTLLAAILLLVAWAASWRRDDSTQAVRHMASSLFGLPYEQVSAEATLGELQLTRQQLAELLSEMEQHFRTTLDAEDDPRLGGESDAWKAIRIVDLADLVRPEWSRKVQERAASREAENAASP